MISDICWCVVAGRRLFAYLLSFLHVHYPFCLVSAVKLYIGRPYCGYSCNHCNFFITNKIIIGRNSVSLRECVILVLLNCVPVAWQPVARKTESSDAAKFASATLDGGWISAVKRTWKVFGCVSGVLMKGITYFFLVDLITLIYLYYVWNKIVTYCYLCYACYGQLGVGL